MARPTVTEALNEAAEVATWQCKTCDVMLKHENTDYCDACCQYWIDVENGLFDDFDPWGWE